MFYIQLYSEREGMSASAPDHAFSGPILGPLSAIYWNRGFLTLEVAGNKYTMQTTEICDHIKYAGEFFNSYRVLSWTDLIDSEMLFCGPPSSVHSEPIFKELIHQ